MINIKGIIRIKMIGAYTERFISELLRQKIKLSNIANRGGVVYADVRAFRYKRIARLSRKYGVMVRIERKQGLLFMLNRHKRRYGVIFGLFAASCMLLSLRQYIWRIEVHGNKKFSTDYLISQLEACGVTAGTLTANVDTTEVERKIKLGNEGISWLNLEINGSRADLYLSESNIPKKAEISLKTPCNVVSLYDALITETDLYAGTLNYKKGDQVGKGSVLVSGAVNDGSDNIVYTHANAKIIGEFTEELDFYQPFSSVEKALTGGVETQKQLMLFGLRLPLYISPIDTDNKLCDEEIESFSFMGIEMPWKIKTERFTGYNETTVNRKAEDVKRLLESKLELYCFDMYKEYEILGISKGYDCTDEGITLHAQVKLKGSITELQPIYVRQN